MLSVKCQCCCFSFFPQDVDGTSAPGKFFFSWLSVANMGQKGLSLRAVFETQNTLGQIGIFQLQTSLFSIWCDKLKVVAEKDMCGYLTSIPSTFWDPDYARRAGHYQTK